MYRFIMEQVDQETVILTANQRLAAYLLSVYNEQQIKTQSVWPTAKILPLNTWLTQCWQSNHQEQLLLSHEQEAALWEKIIKNNATSILQPKQTGKLAAQAWSMLHAWSLNIEDCQNSYHEEVDFFIGIAEHFKQYCKKSHWITQAEITQQLCILIKNGQIALPQKIILAGFDDLPPAIQQLIDLLQQNNVSITQTHADIEAKEISHIEADTHESEIYLMARYAKLHHQKNHQLKIGCVVPQLTILRNPLEKTFTEVFCIENWLSTYNTQKKPFNISSGKALSQFPIAKAALQALTCCNSILNVDALSELLQSPYLCQQEDDVIQGSLCDLRLRQLNEPLLTHSELLAALTAIHQQKPHSTWLKRWKNIIHRIKSLNKKRLPSLWAQQFENVLNEFAWPGPRTLDSTEYQVIKRFKALLTDYGKLDAIIGNITFSEAVSLLHQQANDIVFQAQSHHEPIQVLGILEAIGSEFDILWVMGLSDDVWPPTAKPNPFIPYTLQKTHQMPHSSAERELNYAQSIMQRLCHSASHIVFSNPRSQNDKELQPSQLLSSIKKITEDDLHLPTYHSYAEQVMNSQQLETLPDENALAVTKDESIQGGSWILKQQTNCPFQAFAKTRLHAHSPIQPQLGLSASQRGNLVHFCLERIWSELKSHETLCQKTNEQLQTFIEKTIEDVIRTQPLLNTNRYFFSVEQRRLQKLLFEWLQLEKNRLPFQVLEQEGNHQLQLHQLKLHIKIDRIDQSADGSQMIIDYKTGETNINKWFGEKLEEPQLPLYYIYAQESGKYEQINALSVAEVRMGHMNFKGIVSNDDNDFFIDNTLKEITTLDKISSKNKPDDWQKMLSLWRQALNELSLAFCEGYAAVKPHSPSSCNYCDLQPLCRINE